MKKKQEEMRNSKTKKSKNKYIIHSPSQSSQQGYCSGVFANLILFLCVIIFAGLAKLLLQGTV